MGSVPFPTIKMSSNLIAFLWSGVTLSPWHAVCSASKAAFGVVWGDKEHEKMKLYLQTWECWCLAFWALPEESFFTTLGWGHSPGNKGDLKTLMDYPSCDSNKAQKGFHQLSHNCCFAEGGGSSLPRAAAQTLLIPAQIFHLQVLP